LFIIGSSLLRRYSSKVDSENNGFAIATMFVDTCRRFERVRSQQSPKLFEAPRPPRQDGTGTAVPFDKTHGSELVEELLRAR
jgi:hypothetical protein